MPAVTTSHLGQALAPDVLRKLAERGRRRHYPSGSQVYAQGDPGSEMLIIASGQVEVSTHSLTGRKVVLGHLGPGDLLGEIALLDQGTRSATTTALSDVTGHSVNFSDFKAFLLAHSEAHFALTVELCRKLRNANQILEDKTEKDGAARLALCLLRLAEKFGRTQTNATEIPIALSQGEIGDIAGLTRSNVNRQLRAWVKDGFISIADGRISVLSSEGLAAAAEG